MGFSHYSALFRPHLYTAFNFGPPSSGKAPINQSELSWIPLRWLGARALALWGKAGGPGLVQAEEAAAPGARKSSLQCLWGAHVELELGSSQWGTEGRCGMWEAGSVPKELFPRTGGEHWQRFTPSVRSLVWPHSWHCCEQHVRPDTYWPPSPPELSSATVLWFSLDGRHLNLKLVHKCTENM